MPTLREEMIAKGFLKPQDMLHARAVDLERRYEEASARLAKYDAERKADQEAVLNTKAKAKPCPPWGSAINRESAPAGRENVAFTIHTKGKKKGVDALVLPLTKKEQRLLNHIARLNITPDEREKAQRAFDQSRHLQELLAQRQEKKRLNRVAAHAAQSKKKKKTAKRPRLWISQPSKGSSMFGGVKYSVVRVWQGGLPGLGKRS